MWEQSADSHKMGMSPQGFRQLRLCLLQILGFDILLKSDGMPMLLEVNASPSMRLDYEQTVSPGVVETVKSPVDEDQQQTAASPGVLETVKSPVDEEIKKALVLDTLLVVAPRIRTLHQLPAGAAAATTTGTGTACTPSVDRFYARLAVYAAAPLLCASPSVCPSVTHKRTAKRIVTQPVVKVRGLGGSAPPCFDFGGVCPPLLESEPSLPTAGPKLLNSTKNHNVRCRINKF